MQATKDRPSAHSITSTAPQLNAARPLLAARPRRVKDRHALTRRVHFPRSSLSRNSPRCPASAPFSETCFDSSCSHGVPPSPALPPRRLHPSTTAATSARSCRTSVIPTSFEFLTAGSRERERVVFQRSSQYHETSVSSPRPLNSGLFGSRERERVDGSPRAGARGYPANHSRKLLGD